MSSFESSNWYRKSLNFIIQGFVGKSDVISDKLPTYYKLGCNKFLQVLIIPRLAQNYQALPISVINTVLQDFKYYRTHNFSSSVKNLTQPNFCFFCPSVNEKLNCLLQNHSLSMKNKDFKYFVHDFLQQYFSLAAIN